MIKDQIARNVLTAYLGPNAGRRVLEGHIRRGDGEFSARQACEGALAAARGAPWRGSPQSTASGPTPATTPWPSASGFTLAT